MMVRSTEMGRMPAARTRAATSRSSSRLSMPRVPASVVGNRRPRSPSRAAARRPSLTAWSATSPSEWPCNRGASGMSSPASRNPSSLPNGWLSVPLRIAHRRGRRAGGERAYDVQVGGLGGLEGGGLTGHRDHVHAVACQQLLFVAEQVRPVGEGVDGGRQQLSLRAPWGVCARNSSARSAVPVTMPSLTRLSESITGSTGMAAPCAAAASATRSQP